LFLEVIRKVADRGGSLTDNLRVYDWIFRGIHKMPHSMRTTKEAFHEINLLSIHRNLLRPGVAWDHYDDRNTKASAQA
jgi:hypothetical protein